MILSIFNIYAFLLSRCLFVCLHRLLLCVWQNPRKSKHWKGRQRQRMSMHSWNRKEGVSMRRPRPRHRKPKRHALGRWKVGTEKWKIGISTRRWANVALMLGQRRRGWFNIKTVLAQRTIFVGIRLTLVSCCPNIWYVGPTFGQSHASDEASYHLLIDH